MQDQKIMSHRPTADEEHHSYYSRYIVHAKSDQPVEALKQSHEQVLELFESLTPEQWEHSYAPDKWTIKEVMGHLMDTERVFAYRGLCIGRTETTPLPGFDQAQYAPYANANDRSPESLLDEYKTIRKSTMLLFENFTPVADLRG